ncbi:MAG: division/cell wall cluster transcriptional repressor MraZ [Bacteroidia bacterium]|nr:division/cell wall cluster transcriptional repressor MraZ [Bacteroidia bacterium]
MNLFGVYEGTADAKGRVMLPVAFKSQLGKALSKGFVIKQSIFSKSLELYPMETWDGMVKEVNSLNRFVKKNVEFIRMFNFNVQAVELDGSGRFLMPKDLMKSVGMKRDVVMAAAGNMIEVWDRVLYYRFVKTTSGGFEKLAEEVMGNKAQG